MRECFRWVLVVRVPMVLSRRYNLFAIGIASVMLGYVYGGEVLITPNSSSCHHNSIKDTNHELAKNLDLSLKIAAPLGTFFGPVFFGWLADMMGRKRMCTFESVSLRVVTDPS